MIVEILATGNEVVDGDVVNSNASWLAARMKERGFEPRFHSVVPDDEALIAEALKAAVARADIVLVTGGLGPTVDDLTLEVAAKAFQRPLEIHAESLAKIRGFFQRLGRTISPNQEKQALLPQGSTVLRNDLGTAPGAHWLEGKTHLAFFPGVPKEMQEMFQRQFLPLVEGLGSGVFWARRCCDASDFPRASSTKCFDPCSMSAVRSMGFPWGSACASRLLTFVCGFAAATKKNGAGLSGRREKGPRLRRRCDFR
jgi:nicotinamide-nucleotide amidase